jgi:parallel beta-helix repeat protein
MEIRAMLTSLWPRTKKSAARRLRQRSHRPLLEVLEDRLAPAILTVNTLADESIADNLLSLREAISTVSNATPTSLGSGELAQISGTLGDNDTVTFAQDISGTISLSPWGPFQISRNLKLTGPGAHQVAISGNNASLIFEISTAVSAEISGLTIENGNGLGLRTIGVGGAILNHGTLTISNSTLTGNSGWVGGSIYSDGALLVSGSTLTANSAGSGGGAVYNTSGTLTVRDTIVSNNSSAQWGGGIQSLGGVLTVSNSLFTGNIAESSGGGGIYNDGAMTVSNSTFTGNSAGQSGGGIVNWYFNASPQPVLTNVTLTNNRCRTSGSVGSGGGLWAGLTSSTPLLLNNTIVAGNFTGSSGAAADDLNGTIDGASAYNLIGTGGSGGLQNGLNGNLVGVATPGLAPLADYGSPRQTIALLPGSPAINAGKNALAVDATGHLLNGDQRGFNRVYQGTVDIGAYEAGPTVTNTNDSGPGSLRQAILDANALPGIDAISFAISTNDPSRYYYRDDGVAGHVTVARIAPTSASDDSLIADLDPDSPHSWWSIQPQSLLPEISDAVAIDGFSQPGSRPNTMAEGDDAVRLIEINTEKLRNSDWRLIYGWNRIGLAISAGNTTVRGLRITNYFAAEVSADPYYELPGTAIKLTGAGGNVIEGNYITGPYYSGIRLESSDNNRIGGATPSARNHIVGTSIGVWARGSSHNTFQGNLIEGGNDTASYGDGNFYGVAVVGGSTNLVGGTNAGEGNSLISSDAGVWASSATIRGNTFPAGPWWSGPNVGAIVTAGPTPSPVLTGAVSASGVTTVTGRLSALPNQTYGLDFFSSDNRFYLLESPIASRYLGARNVTTDGSGLATFSFAFTGVTASHFIFTATATGPDGATSRLATAVKSPGIAPVANAGADKAGSEGGPAIALDGSGTFDPVGGTGSLHLTWDFGDGTTETGTYASRQYTSHLYSNSGIYTVTLTADDGVGGISQDTATVTITNTPPSQVHVATHAVSVDQNVSFTLQTSDPSTQDSLVGFQYSIDWGDGRTDVIARTPGNGAGVVAGHAYAAAGLYSVSIVARDVDGGTSVPLSIAVLAGTSGNDRFDITESVLTLNGASYQVPNKTLYAFGANGDDTFIPTGLAGGFYSLIVDGGEGSDLYVLSQEGNSLDFGISDSGASGTDQVTYYGSTGDDHIFKFPHSIYGSGTYPDTGYFSGRVFVITSGTVETVVISAGAGDDNILDPGANTTILGGAGNDTIIINATSGNGVYCDGGDGSDSYVVQFGSLLGLVTIADSGNSGRDSVTVQSSGLDPINVTGNQISQDGQTVTVGSLIPNLNITAPAGAPLPTVMGAAVLANDPDGSGLTDLVVGGTSGPDGIAINPGHQGDGVNVVLNNVPLGVFHPTGSIIVHGYAGNDDISVSGSISLPTELYGDDGNDRIKGGSGTNIELGGNGDDLLTGGSGRDLLIGGNGADRIVGNASDDILIAGKTSFDGDRTALRLILAEWNRTDEDYATRVANIQGTGSGGTFSGRLNGSTFLQANATVIDDGAADVLTGNSGQDWFWANFKGSGVLDKITDLSAAEFANDLDFINAV